MVHDANYWQNRYDTGATGWDLGEVSPPIKAYISHLLDTGIAKDSRILIPGAGNAHEARYLHDLGFSQVYVVDIAHTPLANLAAAIPDFPKAHLMQADFFSLADTLGQFDYIIEQTFFCALDPSLRDAYAKQMRTLLKAGGQLFGVMIIDKPAENPPYGGSADEYQALFNQHFKSVRIEPCLNSIPRRSGREVFIRLS